ncbi:Oidioi.mRNA.OKI2018_I69.PAR.g10718.t1.cds [Oikopleura dioica]|uniref:Oidioi.mRNA.OKI2018_I69.PAR.g10718.t1.cds n=1 Tax=Oikopleura dioica TaxID=34765 RepID=A0ABN7RSA2_OIKDI|nr:Oidioi.mRNA.OKI2018_I69.PAR.g10718.t1.cds [Oikopleura dioica]
MTSPAMAKLAKIKKEEAIPIAIVVAATAFTAATIGALVYRRIVLFFRTSSDQTEFNEPLLLASPRNLAPHQERSKPLLQKKQSSSLKVGKEPSAGILGEQGMAMSKDDHVSISAEKITSKDVRNKTTMQILSKKTKEEDEIIQNEDAPESARAQESTPKEPSSLKPSLSKNSLLDIVSIPDNESIPTSRATSGILCDADQVIDEVLNETFLEDPEFTAEVLPTQTEPEIEPENATESKSLLSSIWSQTGTVTRVLSAMSIASAVSDPSILVDSLYNEKAAPPKKVSSENINVAVNTIFDSMDSATIQGTNDIPSEFVQHAESRLTLKSAYQDTEASISEIPETLDIPFDNPKPQSKPAKPPKFSSAQHLRRHQSSGTIRAPKRRTSTRAVLKEVAWSGTRLPAETGSLRKANTSGGPSDDANSRAKASPRIAKKPTKPVASKNPQCQKALDWAALLDKKSSP